MTAKTDSPIQTVGIAGRGAIGLLYGMQMRSGGVEPWYIADEERIWRYRQDPVAVNGIPQTFRYLQPGTTGNESAGDSHAGPALDLVLIMTKASGLEGALAEIAPFVDNHTIILSCLNGITSEEIVRERYPGNTILRTIVQGIDTVYLQGECRYSHIGEILTGSDGPGQETAVRQVKAFFDSIGMPCRICEDIVREQWNKLMLNCGVNQICAVYGCGYAGAVGEHRELFVRVMEEVRQVALARGIHLGTEDIDRWLTVCEALDGASMPSMAQDIRAGRHTELCLFSGTVVPMAGILGIRVPELSRLQDQILALEAGMEQPSRT